MSALPSGSNALVPIIAYAARRRRAERQAHPAGQGACRVLSYGGLEDIAAGLARTAPLVDHNWTDETLRRYTRLVDTDSYDAWLIDWLPCASVELHDHGGARGAVTVATGTLIETYTDLRWRHPLRARVLDEMSTVGIPATRVHEVHNPGPGRALSVHVYSPPLKSMTFYDARFASALNPCSSTEGDLVWLEKAAT